MKIAAVLHLLGLSLLSAALVQGAGQEKSDGSYRSDTASIQRGHQLFDRYCAACHNFETAEIGPNLAGVTAKRRKAWLASFIRNAPEMIASGDEAAAQLRRQYKQFMPPFPMLEPEEVEQILAYIHTFGGAAAAGSTAKAGALADPIPEKIAPADVTLVLERMVTFPATSSDPPVTRINKLLAVGRGRDERLFVHDLRGKLYEIKGRTPRVYFDLAAQLPQFIHLPGLGTGFGSFAFHPEFASNGLLYTTHTEPAKTAAADFALQQSTPVRLQWVLVEWKTDAPGTEAFSGSRRELLRADMYSQIHGFQELTFNPLARSGDPDYGLLYLAAGDGGAGVTKYWPSCCAAGIWGTVLRIDPAGTNSRNGKYGIPRDNPFVGTPEAPGEMWARGFRNPHRIAWDLTGSRKMFITDIGQTAIEEVNVGVAGAHYGWPQREGTFATDLPATPGAVFPRPPQDAIAYTYPAAQYDHDEGNAISGGFVYAADRIPLLRGKYVFGDIMRGRLFFADVARLEHGRQAPIHELQLETAGRKADLMTLTANKRVDLRFGQDGSGDLYIFTKADGALWKVVGAKEPGR
jgi:glucose/arabinose dehydrogenase/mono/diheme cytochrome c family protein